MNTYTLQPQDIASLILLGDALDEVIAKTCFDIPDELLEELEALQSQTNELLQKIQDSYGLPALKSQ